MKRSHDCSRSPKHGTDISCGFASAGHDGLPSRIKQLGLRPPAPAVFDEGPLTLPNGKPRTRVRSVRRGQIPTWQGVSHTYPHSQIGYQQILGKTVIRPWTVGIICVVRQTQGPSIYRQRESGPLAGTAFSRRSIANDSPRPCHLTQKLTALAHFASSRRPRLSCPRRGVVVG